MNKREFIEQAVFYAIAAGKSLVDTPVENAILYWDLIQTHFDCSEETVLSID